MERLASVSLVSDDQLRSPRNSIKTLLLGIQIVSLRLLLLRDNSVPMLGLDDNLGVKQLEVVLSV